MAKVTAHSALNMKGIYFYQVTEGAYYTEFMDNVFWSFNGHVFEDVYRVYWYDGADFVVSIYGGTGFVVDDDGAVLAGTATGYAESILTGDAYELSWSMLGVAVGAAALYQAHLTPSVADDQAILAAALAGGDTLTGSPEDDVLTGLGGDDLILGGAGADTLEGGAGNDTIDGGAGDDVAILGGVRASYVASRSGSRLFLTGPDGSDEYAAVETFVFADGAVAADQLGVATVSIAPLAASGAEGQSGFTPFTFIVTRSGDLAAIHSIGWVVGGAGANPADAADFGGTLPSGTLTFAAGESSKTITVGVAGDVVTEPDEGFLVTLVGPSGGLGIGTASAAGTILNDDSGGTAGPDTILGTAGDDSLAGLGGDDSLSGLEGADTLDGGSGADTLRGGPGDDLLLVDNTADRVIEALNQGQDTIHATVDFVLPAHVEALILAGAALAGTGNNLPNLILGNAGANTLSGLGGADTMIGGPGDDTYVADATDLLVELPGGGIDRVIATTSFSLASLPDIEHLTLGGSRPTVGTGNAGANLIIGNSAANRLDGLAGNDSLHGGLGDDTLRGGEGADSLFGGGGLDRLEGGPGDDLYRVTEAGVVVVEAADGGIDTVFSTVSFALPNHVENLTLLGGNAIDGIGNGLANRLVGNNFANLLEGLGGADSLAGGHGDDTLIGGPGADTLSGGNGADVFRYAAAHHGLDLITDYDVLRDTIEVSAAGFGGGLTAGMAINTPARFVANTTGLPTAPAGTGQFIYRTDTLSLWFDADGTGPAAARLILTFASAPAGFGGQEIQVIA